MSQIEIGARLQVDPGNSKTTIKELREEIKSAKTDLEGATIGSQEFQKAQERLASAQGQLSAVHKEQASSFAVLNGHLRSSVPAFGGAMDGVKGLQTAFRALMANPIVLLIAAIVAGLKLLYDAFTSVEEGADKVEAVLDGIGAAIRELRDRVLSVGSAIVKFFSGDFSGAVDDAKKAVTGFGDAMVDAFERGKAASEMMDEATDAMRVLGAEHERMNLKLAQAKEILTDETASWKEKKKALQDSGVEVDQYYRRAQENDQKYLRGLLMKFNLEKEYFAMLKVGTHEAAADFDSLMQKRISTKDIEEIYSAMNKATSSEAEFSAKQRQQNKLERNLEKQMDAEAAQAKREADQRRKEADQKAKEEERKRQENHRSYMEKLAQLQQQNELAGIQDTNARKLKELEFAQQKERDQIQEDLRLKKISQEQANELLHEMNLSYQSRADQIRKEAQAKELSDAIKHRDEVLKKEQELADQKTALQQKNTESIVGAIQELPKAERWSIDERRSLLDSSSQTILAQTQWTAQQRFDLEAAYMNARLALDKAEKEQKEQTWAAVGQAAGTLSDVIGKETAAGKALAVAGATIDTYRAVAKALASGPPPLNYVQAAAVALAGFKNVKSILSVQVPAKGGGGGSSPAAPQAPVVPSPVQSTTALDQNSINGIGNAASQAGSRNYILDADFQNNQEKYERINRAARLG